MTTGYAKYFAVYLIVVLVLMIVKEKTRVCEKQLAKKIDKTKKELCRKLLYIAVIWTEIVLCELHFRNLPTYMKRKIVVLFNWKMLQKLNNHHIYLKNSVKQLNIQFCIFLRFFIHWRCLLLTSVGFIQQRTQKKIPIAGEFTHYLMYSDIVIFF